MYSFTSIFFRTEVPWTTFGRAAVIKTKPEIHQHFLRNTLYMVQKILNNRSTRVDWIKLNYDSIVEIATTLYECCVSRLQDFIDFDHTSAILSAECFHFVLAGINSNYKEQFVPLLCKIGEIMRPFDCFMCVAVFSKQDWGRWVRKCTSYSYHKIQWAH